MIESQPRCPYFPCNFPEGECLELCSDYFKSCPPCNQDCRVYAVRESYEYWEGDALNEEDARKKADDEYEQGAWKETNTLDWRIVDVEYVGED